MRREIEQLQSDLELVRRKTGISRVFGANSHHFRLNLPLTEARVTAFETMHGISLPQDYRLFLLLVGNGGAGPYYGLFRLGEMDDGFDFAPWEEGVIVGKLAAPFPHRAAWNDLTGEPDDRLAEEDEEAHERLLNAFEDRYWDSASVNGAIPICHVGCALRQWLVVTGPEAGNVWFDRRADRGGLFPLVGSHGERVTFLRWYRDWLDEALLAS